MPNGMGELRTLALIEGAEAVSDNLENAIVFEIESVVGVGEFPVAALIATEACFFDLGTSVLDVVLERLYSILCRFINGFVSGIDGFLDKFLDTLGGVVERVVSAIQNTVGFLVDSITSQISGLLRTITDKLSAVLDSIVNTLSSIVDAIASQVRALVDKLQDIVSQVLNRIGSAVGTIVNKIGDAVSDLVSSVSRGFDVVSSKLKDVISAIIDAVFIVITNLGSSITNLIDTLVTATETGLGAVRSVIEDIPTALREAAAETQQFLSDKIGAPLSNIGDIFVTQVEAFFERLIDDLDVSPQRIITEFMEGVGAPPDVVARIAGSADDAMPITPFWFAALAPMIIPFLVGATLPTVFGPVFENLRQEVARVVPSTLIPPADSIEAFVRGVTTEAEFKAELDQAGFNDRKKDILLETSRRLIDIGEEFRWWLRDFITEDKLDELLAFHKISPEDITLLKQAVFFIPPVQDLIRMAVREVFTPDIRERFQLDQDFPPEFQEFAKQQAVSDEWARNYWAAHWVLPSVTQGFTMLHRKVITLEELDLLLRAQDVMPFWREKITQVAFSPLTRVDLRRMHRLGLIDDSELQLRYEDLGFDAANADLMVQFTQAFNEPDITEAELEIEGLTRATVVNMFDDGIFTEDEAVGILITMGLSENAASLFIEQRKLERERFERNRIIENVVQLAGGGHININTAQDSLLGIGLTTTEVALAVQRILANRDSRDRLPTLAQINKMKSVDIITDEEWNEAMAGLGFSDVWIERLGELTKGEA